MTWNYRVVSRAYPGPGDHETIREYYIHEVYYDDGRIIGMTENPMEPYGQDEQELKDSIELMLQAFEKPTLKEEELENAFRSGGQK